MRLTAGVSRALLCLVQQAQLGSEGGGLGAAGEAGRARTGVAGVETAALWQTRARFASGGDDDADGLTHFGTR
jgi:hypothetical protein